MILLLLAAQLSAPVAIDSDTWFTAGDVPVTDPRREGLTQVGYGITVAPDGTAQDCRVEESSGDLKTDRHVCGLLLRRAHFTPAKDAAGNPTFGVYRDSVSWWNGAGDQKASDASADLDLTVAELPRKMRSPALIRVKFAVDTKGTPSSCGADEDTDESLVDAACEQVLRRFAAIPARNGAGAPVPSIQDAVVRFTKARS